MSEAKVVAKPAILSLWSDWANLCTLLGVVSGMLGIYFAVAGQFAIAAAMGVIAVILDCFDGPIARRTANRAPHMSAVGLQLDSLADVICSGVGPAVLVLAVGGWHPLYLVPAILLVVAGVTRLAYFNVFGLSGGKFSGFPIFYNPVIIAIVLLVLLLLDRSLAAIGLAIAGVVVAVLNVAPIQIPKLAGRFFTFFVVGSFALTAALLIVAFTEAS